MIGGAVRGEACQALPLYPSRSGYERPNIVPLALRPVDPSYQDVDNTSELNALEMRL